MRPCYLTFQYQREHQRVTDEANLDLLLQRYGELVLHPTFQLEEHSGVRTIVPLNPTDYEFGLTVDCKVCIIEFYVSVKLAERQHPTEPLFLWFKWQTAGRQIIYEAGVSLQHPVECWETTLCTELQRHLSLHTSGVIQPGEPHRAWITALTPRLNPLLATCDRLCDPAT